MHATVAAVPEFLSEAIIIVYNANLWSLVNVQAHVQDSLFQSHDNIVVAMRQNL